MQFLRLRIYANEFSLFARCRLSSALRTLRRDVRAMLECQPTSLTSISNQLFTNAYILYDQSTQARGVVHTRILCLAGLYTALMRYFYTIVFLRITWVAFIVVKSLRAPIYSHFRTRPHFRPSDDDLKIIS